MNRQPAQTPQIINTPLKTNSCILLVESREEKPQINKTLRDLIILTEIEQNGH